MKETKLLHSAWVDMKNRTVTFKEASGGVKKSFESYGNLMEFVLLLAEQGYRVM